MGIPGSFHQHYAMIHALAHELKVKLIGALLTDCYTLSREELVLVFVLKDGEYLTIKVIQQYQTYFLFVEPDKPAKISNAQPCFELLLNQLVTAIVEHAYNRSFAMHFANDMNVVFKLYDGLVNLVLFDKGVVTDLFRKAINKDWELTAKSFEGLVPAEPIDVKEFYLYRRTNNHPYYISFSPQQDELIANSRSAIEIYNRFSKLALNSYRFSYLKQQLTNQTRHELDKTQNHITELAKVIEQRAVRISDNEIANIIMANLHQIPPDSSETDLFDFYRNTQIRVKLKKDLNAQQNAAYYYRKSKNTAEAFLKQDKEVEALNRRVAELTEKLVRIEASMSLRELKPFVKETKSQERQLPFRQFAVEGFDIWVGKSAANNDELTMRHSHKNDLWLHAKDVTGSHVIIKWKPGKLYPNKVIETAAELAAYYSKLKGSNLVPVIYTPKKFVRKPKGADPGSVVVDKEEVLMVRPKLPA